MIKENNNYWLKEENYDEICLTAISQYEFINYVINKIK